MTAAQRAFYERDVPRIVNPPELARPVGFAHGMAAQGELLALGGQIGWDGDSRIVSPEMGAQFAQALKNLVAVVRAAGGLPEDIIQLRVYVTDKQLYIAARQEIGVAWRALLGRHFPAMALVEVQDLLEEGALVEIDGMAVIPGAQP